MTRGVKTTRQEARARLLKPVRHWTYASKAALIVAIRSGLLTLDGALQAHGISGEEYLDWCAVYDKHGVEGLRRTPANYRKRA